MDRKENNKSKNGKKHQQDSSGHMTPFKEKIKGRVFYHSVKEREGQYKRKGG